MKCPEGTIWIPDREFCSRCPFGYIWNAEWNECVKMAKVAEPGAYHTSSAAFWGVESPSSKLPWILLATLTTIFLVYTKQ